jgi:oligoendopeptidase F
MSPVEIGKAVGLNVTDPDFWELGMKRYEHFLKELEKTIRTLPERTRKNRARAHIEN